MKEVDCRSYKTQGSRKTFRFFGVAVLIALMLGGLISVLGGCAGTMQAIENKKMSLSAKMSDTIFLNPEVLEKNNRIYVRVTNTSDFQEINFAQLIKSKLSAKGYTITNKPSEAGYILQANLLYLGAKKKDLTADGMLVGGFGGALAGSAIGKGRRGPALAAEAGAVVGSVVGGLVGSMVHVDTYLGAVDIQIKERVPGGVVGTMRTNAKQGSSTTLKTTRRIESKFQEYRTRIAVKATQTNIDRDKACNAIAQMLGSKIAGMF
jgi:uncharacterized protein YcfJ